MASGCLSDGGEIGSTGGKGIEEATGEPHRYRANFIKANDNEPMEEFALAA